MQDIVVYVVTAVALLVISPTECVWSGITSTNIPNLLYMCICICSYMNNNIYVLSLLLSLLLLLSSSSSSSLSHCSMCRRKGSLSMIWIMIWRLFNSKYYLTQKCSIIIVDWYSTKSSSKSIKCMTHSWQKVMTFVMTLFKVNNIQWWCHLSPHSIAVDFMPIPAGWNAIMAIRLCVRCYFGAMLSIVYPRLTLYGHPFASWSGSDPTLGLITHTQYIPVIMHTMCSGMK